MEVESLDALAINGERGSNSELITDEAVGF